MTFQSLVLSEVASVRMGSPAPQGSEFFSTDGTPFVRVQDVGRVGRTLSLTETKDRINDHAIRTHRPAFAKKGTIVFPKSGAAIATNSRAILGLDAYVVSHLAMIEAVPEIVDTEWLYFYLCTIDMTGFSRTTSLPSLRLSELSQLPVPIPPLPEQRRIIARIKECMERVDEIEELKDASRIQQRYLSASLIESELHPDLTGIEGWTKRTVGELVTTVRNGRSIAQDTEGLADGAVLTLTAVRSIDLGIAYQKPIALPNEVATQFGIDADDVFVSRANTIELVGLSAVAMEAPTGRLIYPDLLIKLKANPTLILPRYLAYALRSASSRRQIKARALGSSQTMVKISGERLREVSIPVPSLAEQAKIISRLDAAHDLMRQLATESLPGEVEVLRGAILRKAFAGEL